ncbi:MAG: hypothetical protein ACTSRI_11070 [Promethearchaeota archaeon]
MQNSKKSPIKIMTVKVVHDLQRQLLEILSLFRVMNNYYRKKSDIQKQIKPLILKKFKEGLKIMENNADWLYSIPTTLKTLSHDYIDKKDSFKFPDSIILFEAWMNLGIQALYPRTVLHFKFPGFLKGEKTRNVFQFIYSTSRGFGFPIYFGPEFYGYEFKYAKILEPLLKWCYTVFHKANQAINLGNKRLKSKRHHPGEFESIIISEYDYNIFKGIDTLLHGYFTRAPKYLGKFSSLEETLQKVTFFYSIGDHAMSVRAKLQERIIDTPLITHDLIVNKYNIDFYYYIKRLMEVNKLLIRKIFFYKKKKKTLISKLKKIDQIRLRIEQSKNFPIQRLKISKKFSEIEKLTQIKHVIENVRKLLWITPLYTHTLHDPAKDKKIYTFNEKSDYFEQESTNSILLSYIKNYEKRHNFIFEEKDIFDALKSLRDLMGNMWLFFKERQFKYAKKKINEISILSLDDENYRKKINDYLEKLIPIISIYELFQRPLSESVYPESIPQTKRLGAFIAKFLTSKYNPIGLNLMKLLNKLSFYNWSYFIVNKKLNLNKFFNLTLNLPIWKYIPDKVKSKILSYNS